MKKTALVFILAVFVPTLALAWIAARSLRNQQLIVERQETLLCQAAADSIVQNILAQISKQQAAFAAAVETLLLTQEPARLGYPFDERIRSSWPLAQLGFAVALNGEVLSPLPWDSVAAKRFRIENDLFLCSRETVDVVWQSPKGKVSVGHLDDSMRKEDKSVFATKGGAPLDTASAGSAQFRQIIGTSQEGTLARFLQDELVLLFWYRSLLDTNMVFGAQLKLPVLVEYLRPSISLERPLNDLFAVALRDDNGHVVALSRENFTTNWKRPFISTEIGEVLPHWELGLYLIDPARLHHTASAIQWTVGLLIGTLLVAIIVGSWLIGRDLHRELLLARHKTDFVSNVSHELKTPLTSIRMFSEMLSEGRVADPANQQRFMRIISAEAARLTRLINNVLEFARRERGEEKYHFSTLDLGELSERTIESYRPNLEANGFIIKTDLPSKPLAVHGDADALSQVLLNLLSNAEKYSGEQKEIEIVLRAHEAKAALTVCDRGLGVPSGLEEKIFEKFFRAHDSLASGIQGTGLGLTLARQIALAHSGDVTYKSREGGGSCFTLELPLLNHNPGIARRNA
jgi:signal transduction histidine kinase